MKKLTTGEFIENAMKVHDILDNHTIYYNPEKRFKECRDKNPLPFDFYLKEYNLCIEYDGEQHFNPISYFGGHDNFNKTVSHDHIKNEFCENNGIRLLRISYKDYENIEAILMSVIGEN